MGQGRSLVFQTKWNLDIHTFSFFLEALSIFIRREKKRQPSTDLFTLTFPRRTADQKKRNLYVVRIA
jgi:hypothetical protein